MEYMSKVEQDILVMIRTEIDLHVRQNFQDDLERQKSISTDKEALTNSLRDINNQMSELKLKKETLIQKTTSGDTTESKINRLKILIDDTQRMKQKSIESLEFQLNHLEGDFSNMTLVKTDEEVVGADTAQIVKAIQEEVDTLNQEIKNIMGNITLLREKDSNRKKKKEQEYLNLELQIKEEEQRLRLEITHKQSEILRVQTQCINENVKRRREKEQQERQVEKKAYIEKITGDLAYQQ